MVLEQLSVKEWTMLAARAERKCFRCFRRLAAEAGDRDLARWLNGLAEDEDRHGQAIERFAEGVPWPLTWRTDEPELDRLVAQNFPTLDRAMKTPPPDRRAALEAVQGIEEEAVRFYGRLSDHAPDEESRGFFARLKSAEESHAIPPGGE